MAEYIERGTAIAKLTALEVAEPSATMADAKRLLADMPAVDVEEMSDGYHTFDDLYEQRLILSAALAKNNPHAWKSKRHEDGSVPFGGGWFIMGFDTDEGCYTYHYELKDWDLFQCEELDKGKPWDGHTSKDVRRLLSIPAADGAPVVHGRWIDPPIWGRGVCACSECKEKSVIFAFSNGEISEKYCPLCGARMDGDSVMAESVGQDAARKGDGDSDALD